MGKDNNLQERIAALESRLRGLQEKVNLAAIRDRIEDVAAKLRELPAKVEELRARGYVFRSFLENKVKVLGKQWDEVKPQIEQELTSEAKRLKQALDGIEKRMAGLRGKLGAVASQIAGTQKVAEIEGAVGDLEAKTAAAERTLGGMFDQVEQTLEQTLAQISEIFWTLEQSDEASFQMQPTEAIVIAARAEWTSAGSKPYPEGILFLTDQRLIFEQKEKVGGGLFRRGEFVQEVKWALPIGQIETVKAEKRGILGGKDMLIINLAAGAPYSQIEVEVKGGVDCRYWAQQINRVRSGEIASERAVPVDEEAEKAAREAPTACPVCGAPFTEPITRGMTEIKCQYCGSVTRL